jgi:hypothetical protein
MGYTLSMATTTYTIPSQNIDLLKNEIVKINKKIEKLNKKNGAALSPVTMEVGAAVIKSVCVNEITGMYADRIFFPVTITGEAAMVSGWSFIATLTHLDEGVIVRAVPGVTAEGELAKYRDEESKCDQCGWKRRRLDTYVVRNEAGEHKVVGSTCLGDFFPGANPHTAAKYASYLAAAGSFAGACENEGFGSNASAERYVTIQQYLPWVALATRLNGWLSGGKAWEMGNKDAATAAVAWKMMFDRSKDAVQPSDKDIATAAPVVEYINSHYEVSPPAADKDFDQNLSIVYKSGVVDFKLKGIVAFGIEFMKKQMAYEANKRAEAEIAARFGGLNPANSTFQGDATKKNLIFKGLTCVDAGGRRPVKFVDAAGNLFKCWSNKIDFTPVPGTTYDLRTTSISHEEDKYNQNAKTTSLGKTRIATEKELTVKVRAPKTTKAAILAAAINA